MMFMKLKALYGVYYSACGNTRKVIETAAETLQQYLCKLLNKVRNSSH